MRSSLSASKAKHRLTGCHLLGLNSQMHMVPRDNTDKAGFTPVVQQICKAAAVVGSLVVQEVCSSPRVLLTVKTATAAAASAAEGLVVAQQRAPGCAAKLC